MSNQCVFSNDNNAVITLVDHPFSHMLARRNNHEVLFRRISTFLILSGNIRSNIIDLGAWIGDNTVPWAKNIGIDNIVYAIDPSTENCDFIKQTCDINNITNVEVIQTAISDKNEMLSTNDELTHCSFLSGGAHKVSAVTLDYLFQNNTINNVGYIHLDVEGLEYRVILGADKLIDAMRPIIAFEQHLETDNVTELIGHMNNKQYVVFMIDEVLPGCFPDCRNFLAFPNEKFDVKIMDELNLFIRRPEFL